MMCTVVRCLAQHMSMTVMQTISKPFIRLWHCNYMKVGDTTAFEQHQPSHLKIREILSLNLLVSLCHSITVCDVQSGNNSRNSETASPSPAVTVRWNCIMRPCSICYQSS